MQPRSRSPGSARHASSSGPRSSDSPRPASTSRVLLARRGRRHRRARVVAAPTRAIAVRVTARAARPGSDADRAGGVVDAALGDRHRRRRARDRAARRRRRAGHGGARQRRAQRGAGRGPTPRTVTAVTDGRLFTRSPFPEATPPPSLLRASSSRVDEGEKRDGRRRCLSRPIAVAGHRRCSPPRAAVRWRWRDVSVDTEPVATRAPLPREPQRHHRGVAAQRRDPLPGDRCGPEPRLVGPLRRDQRRHHHDAAHARPGDRRGARDRARSPACSRCGRSRRTARRSHSHRRMPDGSDTYHPTSKDPTPLVIVRRGDPEPQVLVGARQRGARGVLALG